MKRIYIKLLAPIFALSLFGLNAPATLAATPVLSAYSQGGGNLQITVNSADPYARVDVYYRPQGTSLWTTITNVGTADQNGYFSQNISIGTNSGQADMYVIANSKQSGTVSVVPGGSGGCGIYGCSGGSLSLSQTSVNLSLNQTATVNVYGAIGNIYVSNNTNPTVASVSVSGNTVNIYGNTAGSTTANICSNNSSSCVSLFVSVQDSGSGGSFVSFSQNNLNLGIGQSQNVNIFGGSSFYISSNTNPNVVSANLTGSSLSLFGNSLGSSTITVCNNNFSIQCGSLYVTVGGGSVSGTNTVIMTDNIYSPKVIVVPIGATVTWRNNGSMVHTVTSDDNVFSSGSIPVGGSFSRTFNVAGTYNYHCIFHGTAGGGGMAGTIIVTNNTSGNQQLTFSENNLSLNLDQSKTVNVYGGTGANFYVSSNSNSSIVQASVSGSVVSLYASSFGSAIITLCSSANSLQCGALYITVVSGSGGGQISFSQQTVNLTSGQSRQINIYSSSNNYNYYISSNSNSSVVSASLIGSTLTLVGNASGTSNVVVCNSGFSTQCGTVYVFVNGNSSNNQIWFSQNNLNLSIGQSHAVTIYSNISSGYYLSGNNNNGVVTASLSGNTLNLYGIQNGSATISVCVATSNNCGNVFVSVGGGFGNITFSQPSVNVGTGQSVSVSVYGGFNNNYYVANNSNSSVASASISGSSVNIYGLSNGNTTVGICGSNSSQCGSLFVSVVGNTGGLTFQTTSLAQPQINQYYNEQIIVSGGNFPYTFNLNSGALPSGLILTQDGRVTGTPTSSGTYNFQVRVSDFLSRTGFGNFVLTVFQPTINTNPGLQIPPSGVVLGANIFPNGTLINDNGTIYIVYKNTKTGFSNYSAFIGLGFKASNALFISSYGLFDSGFVVRTANASHPWGSWIKRGNTVYFVHESGLIPVPSPEVFISNGGDWRLVVNANIFDNNYAILDVMILGDSRLK